MQSSDMIIPKHNTLYFLKVEEKDKRNGIAGNFRDNDFRK